LCHAAALILPPGAAISGVSAVYLHGADVLDNGAPVEVTVLKQIRTQPGIDVHRTAL
jgi:hypothetical protein